MLQKIFRVLANVILVLLPTFPIMENIYPVVDNGNFGGYILGCLILSAVVLILAILINRLGRLKRQNSPVMMFAWGLIAIGILSMYPLHLGAPREDDSLLAAAGIERFRYAMLLVAVTVFALICLGLFRSLRPGLRAGDVFFYTALFITLLVNLWDNYSSYQLSAQMKEWAATGSNAADFFGQYDFHEGLRTLARVSLYVMSLWIAILAARQQLIRKWEIVLLSLFCITGVVFCILFINLGFAYYFPFMVPAIALAPAYWLGIVLLNKKSVVIKDVKVKVERYSSAPVFTKGAGSV